MDKKQKYINKALVIFKQEGLRLSIDELAAKMGISKKTLYNHFDSKDTLLRQCIHHVFTDLNSNMELLIDENKNAIECMQQSFHALSIFFQDHSPVFISDLNKLYPDMISEKHTSKLGPFSETIKLNLEKGIKEGLYASELDIRLISRYFVHSIFGFFFQSIISDNEFSANNYFETVVIYNLKALSTDKGRKLINLKIKS
ncbi:MAG: TetR/AcrR family transcriptional regulator [Prolixibacteraceae bacterium]